MRFLCLLSLIMLFSCKGSKTSSENSVAEIPFQTLITASQSNIEEPQQRIIDSQNELESIFSEINKTRKPGIPIPEIDFNKKVAAFVNFGQTSTGGYSVSIKKVEKNKEEIVVYVTEKSPQPKENVIMVLTTPFTMVKFNKQSLPIVFKTSLEN